MVLMFICARDSLISTSKEGVTLFSVCFCSGQDLTGVALTTWVFSAAPVTDDGLLVTQRSIQVAMRPFL